MVRRLLFALALMAVLLAGWTSASFAFIPEVPAECSCCPASCGNGLLTGCNVVFGSTVVCLYGPPMQACALCGID